MANTKFKPASIEAAKVIVGDPTGATNAGDVNISGDFKKNGTPIGGASITSLTGDVTATGPGAAATILATVNSNVGSFTNANVTVNAKGLVTAAANGNSPVIAVDASFVAGIDPGQVPVYISNAAGTITAIRARLETASGAAATLQPVKAASGAAISAGTNLTTNTFNANGTPATNQTMTLHGTPANLVLAAGDCLGFISSGTFTASVGGLTFFITP